VGVGEYIGLRMFLEFAGSLTLKPADSI